MTEQWFLDLDGVRSGPYQTPEVMSLIAEGEVLPHHRISTSLRDQRWVTVLDWRLDQAKISTHTPSSSSKSRSEVFSVEGLNDAPTETIEISNPIEKPTEPDLEKTPPFGIKALSETKASLPPEEKPVQEPHSEVEASMELPKEETPGFHRKKDSFPLPLVNEATLEEPEEETTRPPSENKRDPMAEMYDMLQNTKQKKQARQNQEAANGISIELDHGVSAKKVGLGLGRTLAIGLGITLVGFALGQLFQQSEPAPKEQNSTIAAKTEATPAAAAPDATPITEVIDRSNDKMTIKGYVQKDPQASSSPAAKVNTRINRFGGGGTANPETPQTEKELEELRNLKKELQELKNLKNTAVDESPEMNDTQDQPAPNIDPNRPDGQNLDPNGPQNTNPADGGTIQNNTNNPNPNGP